MLTSRFKVIATMSYASHHIVFEFLKSFQVPNLLWVIVAVPYAYTLYRVSPFTYVPLYF